jgi:protein TonB
MKNPKLYALNIGTLAFWLSVSVSGAVAILVPSFRPQLSTPREIETTLFAEDFSLGEIADRQADQESSDPPSDSSEPLATPMLAPPALPEVSSFEALPEIPDLPAAAERSEPTASAPKPAVREATAGRPKTASTSATAPAKKSSAGKPAAGSGMSVAARLAAGRMPRPTYPALSRRNNQTGTVVVQFTIGTDGNVVAASIYKSSNWPLLDREALRTVRTWRFPSGDVMTNIKPITFTLQ